MSILPFADRRSRDDLIATFNAFGNDVFPIRQAFLKIYLEKTAYSKID